MLHPANIPQFPECTPEAVVRFARVIGGLLEAIARAFSIHPRPPVPEPVIILYIQRTRRRFERLMARLRAGIPHCPRKPREKSHRPESARKTPRLRLPTRKGWLRHEIGEFGRQYAIGLAYTLNQPETAALIAGSPQAQRLLRPLCRMLALDIPAITPLPRRPRKPRPTKPKRLTRKQREAILWYPNSEGKPMKLLPRRLPRD